MEDKIQNRDQFGVMLNSMGLTQVAVEVGVHRGEFSKPFLDSWNGRRMFLVDPWCKLDSYDGDPINNGDRVLDMNACMDAVGKHMDRVTFLRLTSEQAVDHFLDDYIDFLYLDANHEEEFVREDWGLWLPKVKVGGVMACHDYLSTVTWPGVQKVCNEQAAFHGYELNLTWETGGSAWFVKTHKERAT